MKETNQELGFLTRNGQLSPQEAERYIKPIRDRFPQTRAEYGRRLYETHIFDWFGDVLNLGLDLTKALLIERQRLLLNQLYHGENVPRGDGSSVVIIPGFLAMGWQYQDSVNVLNRVGYQAKTYPLRYGINIEPMEFMVDDLMNYLKEEKIKSKHRVNVAGHSKGGLLIGAAFATHPDEFDELVDHAIFVGSPIPQKVSNAIGGAYLATQYIFGGDDFKLSTKIADLEGLAHSKRVKTTLIISEDDPILQGDSFGFAKNCFAVKGSHSGLMMNPEVLWLMAYRMADYELAAA